MRVHEYTLKELAAYLTLHYATIRVIAKRVDRESGHQKQRPDPKRWNAARDVLYRRDRSDLAYPVAQSAATAPSSNRIVECGSASTSIPREASGG